MSRQESFANMHSAGGALRRALHEAAIEIGGEDTLKTHPGKGVTVLQLGMERLRRRAATMELRDDVWRDVEAAAYREYAKGDALCESPIERAMLAALITGEWSGFETIPPRVHSALDKSEMLPAGDLIIVPQMAFLRYRLDFGVVVQVKGRKHVVAIECDGADFHTDYQRENRRVDYLKSWDIPVFKFTGSELHEDAIGAAHRAILSICMWRDAQ